MKNNKYLFRTKTCPNCKEKFTKRMPEKRIFCSRECSFLFCRGKNSHMWIRKHGNRSTKGVNRIERKI